LENAELKYYIGRNKSEKLKSAHMKYFQPILFFCFIILSAFSCNDRRFSEEGKMVVDKIHKKQQECLEGLPPACVVNMAYCDNPTCWDAIVHCHEITESDFNAMVPDRGTGEEKMAADVHTVVDAADCRTEVFKLKFNLFGDIKMSKEPASTAVPVHYSIVLIRGILAKGPSSFTFYKGYKSGIDDIPFKVDYLDGTVHYYDVSDLPTKK